jgi:hypothetical protein
MVDLLLSAAVERLRNVSPMERQWTLQLLWLPRELLVTAQIGRAVAIPKIIQIGRAATKLLIW